MDSSKMAEAQLRFAANTGVGIIKCGSVVISFDNQFSKDIDLYRLYNTNIHDKIGGTQETRNFHLSRMLIVKNNSSWYN